MTPNHARMLAVEIVDSWQEENKIALEVWVAELDPLDYQLAHTTISRLRQSELRPPSVATFHATYSSIRRANQPDPVAELRDVKAVSRNDYLSELRRRAKFDPAAECEIARWERLAARRRHPSHPDQPTVIGPT